MYLGKNTGPLAFAGALMPRRTAYPERHRRWTALQHSIPTLELATERTSSWSCVISVSGELDRVTAPTLRQLVDEEISNERVRQLVVDLEHVDFVDGGGLRLLLEASEAMRKSGRRFCVVCTNPHVLRLFTLTDARGHLNVVRSRATALHDAVA